MKSSEFEAKLKEAGYCEIMTSSKDPQPPNGQHGHEFAIRGLVTAGEFIIFFDGVPRSYKLGQIFDVAAGQLHSEAVGPEGTIVTTGRKH